MSNKQIQIGGIISYIKLVCYAIFSIIYIPLIVKYLGQDDYGLYSLIFSIMNYFTIFDFGLSNAIIKFSTEYHLSGDREGQEKVYFIFLSLYIMIALTIVSIGFFTVPYFTKVFAKTISNIYANSFSYTIMICIVFIAFRVWSNIFIGIITSYNKHIFLQSVSLIVTISYSVTNIILLKNGYKLYSLIYSYIIINTVACIFYIIYVLFIMKIKFHFRKPDVLILKKIFDYSIFVFVMSIVEQFFWKIDQMLLGILSGAKSIAIYSIAAQFNEYYKLFSNSITNIMFPSLIRNDIENKNNENITDLFLQISRVQFFIMGMILSGFVIFGKQFIIIWVGYDFYDSYLITLILMIVNFIPAIQSAGIGILQSKNKHKFRSKLFILLSILNILLSIPLAIRYGALGCALGTCVSIIIGDILIGNWYYKNVIGLQMKRYWNNLKRLFLILFFIIIFSCVLNYYIIDYGLIFSLLKILIYILFYIIIMWNFALTKIEKNILKNLFFG